MRNKTGGDAAYHRSDHTTVTYDEEAKMLYIGKHVRSKGLRQYCVDEDYDNFELCLGLDNEFSFPCVVCVHRVEEITCDACKECGHIHNH